MGVAAGKLRISQAATQNGPGSLIDLPTLSMIVMASDDWELGQARSIDEPRLARRLGVKRFRNPPYRTKYGGGLPVKTFPRFLVCPRCHRLADHTKFTFEPRKARSQYVCKAPDCDGKGRAVAYPARFMVACAKGHLSDFPWHRFVHPDVQCDSELLLEDTGQTGAISDLLVKCPTHNAMKNLGSAFGPSGRDNLPLCSAQRPWLGDTDPEGCDEQPRVLLRGASNAYFPLIVSALSIPPWSEPVQVALGSYAEQMTKLDSAEKVASWLELTDAPELDQFTAEQIYSALVRRREGAKETALDLRQEEWRVLQSKPATIQSRAEFQAKVVDAPPVPGEFIERVLLLERLREVRALRGFTRIDPNPDIGDLGEVQALKSGMAPIMRSQKTTDWYPGVDFRGEGIFIQLNEQVVADWEKSPAVVKMAERHADAEKAWCDARGLPFRPAPSRYLLLHTLSHVVIRQLSLDCGYASTSLRERIYSSTDSDMPMAGFMIYTATPDSDGSLGGLVELGRPDDLGPLIKHALEGAALCAGDPFCASRRPEDDSGELNGAACHACLLIAETACEAGNRHLDRAALVPTLRRSDTAFVSA
jgi:hypothetical protein